MPDKKWISVITCTYAKERFEQLRQAVESVENQKITPQEIIIAIDQNDDLYKLAQNCFNSDEIKVVLNKGAKGTSATRNAGIQVASGDILAFIDDDARAESNWLSELVSPFENESVIAVGGCSIPNWPSGSAPNWFPEEYDFIIGCTNHKKLIVNNDGTIRNVTGSNMAFRRTVFEEVGLWNTKLGRGQNKTGGEEAELCLRIKAKYPDSMILYKPEAIVLHTVANQRITLSYVFDYAYNEGIVRAMVERDCSKVMRNSLAAEHKYFTNILFKVIPGKLANIHKKNSLPQLLVIIVNTILIVFGYVIGRMKTGRV